jgi:peptidoglycan hydrolase-like protein with peptidoglycan-binding domain
MKKAIIAGIVLCATLTSASASLTSNLKYGQRSPQITELQDFLADKGFLAASPTGYFGLLTLKAVKNYQTDRNLPSTGFVGPMTREIINAELLKVTEETDQAELNETGTTTPVSSGNAPAATTTIVYVPVYVPTPAPVSTGAPANDSVTVVAPQRAKTFRVDNYNGPWLNVYIDKDLDTNSLKIANATSTISVVASSVEKDSMQYVTDGVRHYVFSLSKDLKEYVNTTGAPMDIGWFKITLKDVDGLEYTKDMQVGVTRR